MLNKILLSAVMTVDLMSKVLDKSHFLPMSKKTNNISKPIFNQLVHLLIVHFIKENIWKN